MPGAWLKQPKTRPTSVNTEQVIQLPMAIKSIKQCSQWSTF